MNYFDEELCCICLSDDRHRKLLRCNTCVAVFHERCITSMLIQNEYYTGCPVCREPLPNSTCISKVEYMYRTFKWISELPITGFICGSLLTFLMINCLSSIEADYSEYENNHRRNDFLLDDDFMLMM
jgi:hypothetical protein